MKKLSVLFSALLILTLLLTACAGAGGGNNQTTPGAGNEGDVVGVTPGAGGENSGIPQTGMTGEELEGATVYDLSGMEIGNVERVVDDGGIVYAVINRNGQYVVVPNNAFTLQEDRVTLTADASVLAGAPTFTTAEEIDPADPSFDEVSNYWATQDLSQ